MNHQTSINLNQQAGSQPSDSGRLRDGSEPLAGFALKIAALASKTQRQIKIVP